MGRIVKALILYSILTTVILGVSYIVNCMFPEAEITVLPGIHVEARQILDCMTTFIMVIPGWILTLAALVTALARS